MGLELVITLVVVGLVLILAEVFVPGGVIGSVGGLLLAVGIVLGFRESVTLGFVLLLVSIVFGCVGLWAWVKFFPRTPMGKRFILQETADTWDGYDTRNHELLGKSGVSRSPLRPAGTATIEGKRIDVVTRGEMIPADRRVRVIQVEGNRIVVEADVEEGEEVV